MSKLVEIPNMLPLIIACVVALLVAVDRHKKLSLAHLMIGVTCIAVLLSLWRFDYHCRRVMESSTTTLYQIRGLLKSAEYSRDKCDSLLVTADDKTIIITLNKRPDDTWSWTDTVPVRVNDLWTNKTFEVVGNELKPDPTVKPVLIPSPAITGDGNE